MKNRDKKDLLDFSPQMLEDFVVSFGEKPFRGRQIAQWLFEKGIRNIDEMTNISLDQRNKIKEHAYIGSIEIVNEVRSADGTEKMLLGLDDGHNLEIALIPDSDRLTLCISTQVGCKMACLFCSTGTTGFVRNLRQGEILGQIQTVERELSGNAKITNIVLMGIGEPFDNYENVVSAVRILTSTPGMGFPAKRISISTSGVIPGINNLADEEDINVKLAVSLNASDNDTRSKIMPINKKHPIPDLLQACKNYSNKKRKSVLFEYVLLGGINDTAEDAKRLVSLLTGLKCKINLIPFNPFKGAPYSGPNPDDVTRFHSILIEKGFTVFTRKNMGGDINAACGQLRACSAPIKPG